MSQGINQENVYSATPARIYALLTEAAEFSKMSGGAPAEIDAQDGGAFSCFGGMIHGRIIECVPGERLVQAWRAKTWEPGVYSIVRFDLSAEGEGTKVVLNHSAFPEGQGEHLSEGWGQNYWEPMKKLLSAE
jgi:uncharacterized protein YndB with AHSA1/START domain